MENNINFPTNEFLERNIKGGANWFYWIVGLSIINAIMIFFNYDFNILGGLGITYKSAIIAQEYHGSSTGFIAVVVMVAFFALFILFGYYGRKLKRWAFIAGMIIYFADGLLLALSRDWFSVGFHVLFLIFIVFSFVVLQKYRKMTADKTNHYKV